MTAICGIGATSRHAIGGGTADYSADVVALVIVVAISALEICKSS
ncbi:MAG: hypothetical protein ACXV5I_07780 [Halobacteriota archaeon]